MTACMERRMIEGSIQSSHCNACLRSTRHDVLKVHTVEDSYDNGQCIEGWRYTYTFLACRGCGTASMRMDYFESLVGDYDPVIYPAIRSRRPPQWTWSLPREWRELLQEVYTAIDADSRRLAVMGARTLVDLYLTEAVGNTGKFEERLERLVQSGRLASSDKATLRAALEAGNAAAHRGYNPAVTDLNIVMDIVEHLLQKHVLQHNAKSLAASTPSRPK